MNIDEVHQAPTHLGPIEYRDLGQGPVLVFLHPILSDGRHWDRVISLVQDRFRCIVPTLPLGAHRLAADANADLSCDGLARAVADVLAHLDIDDATLVGNDTGGAIAQVVAVNHPERLKSVVLTNCDMFEVFPPRLFKYFRLLPYVPGSLQVLARVFKVNRVRSLPIALGMLCNEVDGDLVESWAQALLASSDVRRDALEVIRGISPDVTERAAEALGSTDLPFLVVWGADDRLFKRSLAERFCRQVPTAELVMVKDSKTFVCWDQPESLASHIASFVGSAAPV